MNIYSEISKAVNTLKKDGAIYVGVVDLNESGNWTYLNGYPASNLLYEWYTGEAAYNEENNIKCSLVFENKLWAYYCDKDEEYSLCQVDTGKC